MISVLLSSVSLFAFTHRGRQFTWTRLPQGFIDSPAMFSSTVRQALEELVIPEGSCVLQYADDLLVSACDLSTCQVATLALLHLLAEKGFKVSKSKLQLCCTQVQYLGYELSQGMRRLTQERIQIILDTKRPATKHALMASGG
ncbi:MAG: reverse transcriptase domain-containing protein [Gammaproteobacteria bacterium]